MWLSSGRITNPGIDQVVLDTGPLPAGVRNFQAMGSGTVATAFEIQHRNALNDTTLHSQIFAVPISGSEKIPPLLRDLDMAINERIRIVTVLAIVGSISVSLDITL